MDRFIGLLGVVMILSIAFLFSNNRKAINYRLVVSGLALQLTLAVLILKVPVVTRFFQTLGHGMEKIEQFAREGAKFCFGNILPNPPEAAKVFGGANAFIFAFNIPATIILVCVLVAILYHFGIMQRVVALIARAVHFLMHASGAEALSNVASAFVGQVEAQVMIRPYLKGMTNSELLASMSGSMACIAGGILIVYVNMGVPAEYLIAASLMAAPAALVISKIVYPETEVSETKGNVSIEVKSHYTNVIDAISHGASDGMKISINVIAMLIGFIGLIALVNYILGMISPGFSLNVIFGWGFYPIAWAMGVPANEAKTVATLMGQKMVVNEFVAYLNLIPMKETLSPKGLMIASFALCGFANFSSVGMQIGGIGELAPERRGDLAKLGLRALLCGTLASYLSATIAGILL
ncbi:MAG: NupC/NupG family nucleoside CNT transporter [Bacteroidetes bacterium]|nr:NupC/NupG family nucleoside CNT transporter [Bacteroidota bacterium]MBK8659592.1 NupC/NupG family nucleoside CNT transporter [Bacteroidota bacterium]